MANKNTRMPLLSREELIEYGVACADYARTQRHLCNFELANMWQGVANIYLKGEYVDGTPPSSVRAYPRTTD